MQFCATMLFNRLFDLAEALAKALEERGSEACCAKFAGDHGSSNRAARVSVAELVADVI
jgi:hypothetical protein